MRRVKISDVCITSSNIRWKDFDNDTNFCYIDLTSVDRDTNSIVNPTTITKETAPSRALRIVHTDDVIFATTRPTLRRVCIIPSDYNKQICSTGFCVLRPVQNAILPKYLFLILLSDDFYEYIEPLQTGATYPAITDRDVRSFEIPLPSLEEQQRIVDILDKEFEKIDTLKANAEKGLQNAKDFFQSVLKKELQPKEGWITNKLNTFATYSIGLTYKPTDVSDTGTIVLRSSNIQNNAIDLSDIVRVECKIKEDLFVQDGDVLMCSRNGSARLVGKVAIIKDCKEAMTYGTFMTIIRGEYNLLLFYFFLSDDFRKQISKGENTMINQITKYMLDDIVISLPNDKNEMYSMASRLDGINEQCKALQENYEKTIALCDDMKQALLRKAFNGELNTYTI